MITLIVVVVILAVDFVGRAKVYSDINDIEDPEDGRYGNYWDDYDEEDKYYEAKNVMEAWCGMDFFGGLIMAVLFIVSASLLFAARRSYGQRMERKFIAVFVLSIVIPVVVLVMWFIFNLFEVSNISIISAFSILLFNVALFLSLYDLDREKVKFAAFFTVILFTVPLFFIMYDFDMIGGYYNSHDDFEHVKTACVLLMIADIGLIAGLSTYFYSFRKALQFTKANPPQQDSLEMRLMTQQAQQLRMEVEILRLQKEQMDLLSDIRSDRIEGASTGLLTHGDGVESTVGGTQNRMGEHLREYDPSKR